MRSEIRITSSQWQDLQAHLLADDYEHAAVLICGTVITPAAWLMLVREVVPLAGEDLIEHGEQHLSVDPVSIARLAKRAARANGSVIICHSHPFPGRVGPSLLDLDTEAQLCGRALAGRLAPRPTGSLIIGPDGASARLYAAGDGPVDAAVRIIGDSVTTLPGPDAGPEGGASAFDRQVRAWGAGGQAAIAAARVAVVGTGGTGSHVVTQLAHLGVRTLLLIDPDVVETTNLPRLIGAAAGDVGALKAGVLAAAARTINPLAEIRVVPDSVLDTDPALLADMDVVFCCTDGHGSRVLLTELAQQYCVPVIDLGVEIVPSPGGTRAGGGVRILRPGQGCLHCAGTLDPALIREEYLNPGEREAERKRGYLRGSAEPAPSVVALNGVAASLAVLEFCQMMAGMFPSGRQRLLYRAEQRRLTTASMRREPGCHVCGDRGLLGAGDGSAVSTRWRPAADPGPAVRAG
ncbi:MAG TPA: ThiF family adenylyltransferase [Streptosporangiaceae bacterium]|nr:ThiF family adenylyltransferase [Streptosporangiaceae bacterium]